MSFAIVLMCEKMPEQVWLHDVNDMLLIKQLRLCLNIQSDSIHAKGLCLTYAINDSGLLVTLEITYLI